MMTELTINHRAILCLDDEETILTSLKSQLRRNFGAEYRYEFAQNAEEAFEVIDELVEDHVSILIIVSDWLMPGMRGDEFLIKVHQKFPGIVKVMLTGQADLKAVENARKRANLFRCLYKPWEEEELVETIKKGLAS